MKPTPLIPLETLTAPAEIASPRLSPDGQWIAAIKPLDGAPNLWLGPADDFSSARPLTRYEGRGLAATDISGDDAFRWAHNGTHLVFARDNDGDENWLLYSTELASGETKLLTPFANTQVRIIASTGERPDHFLIAMNDRDPAWHDPYLLNIVTGELQQIERNERFYAYIADNDLRLRLAVGIGEDATLELHRAQEGGGWEFFRRLGNPENPDSQIGFDRHNRILTHYDSSERDRRALVATDLQTGETTLVAEDPRVDIGRVLVHPSEGTIQAYTTLYTSVQWHILDSSIADDMRRLESLREGELSVDGRSRDDQTWLVRYTLDDAPETWFLYERKQRETRKLFVSTPSLEDLPLSQLHPVVTQSRDGLELVSYLMLPPWTDPGATGRPDEALPMVVLVHGGPSDERAQHGFFPIAHWLANRGYALLLANFRGSPGFGKAFLEAQRLEWGGRMHDDIVDQVKWAVDEGVAREDAVGILGGSYGGYEALVAMTFTPELFACGISVVGPSNLETFIETIPPFWSLDALAHRIGDPRTAEGREHLKARSPYYHVDRANKPLLIGQGAHDVRVPQRESDQIAEALDRRGVPVSYVVYPDEGHGFIRPENDRSFNAIVEVFLAEHLGGRCQTIRDELLGSSAQVPIGAAHIPGLEAALARRARSEPGEA